MSVGTTTPLVTAPMGAVTTRSWRAPIAFTFFGVVAFVAFGLFGEAGERSTFRPAPSG